MFLLELRGMFERGARLHDSTLGHCASGAIAFGGGWHTASAKLQGLIQAVPGQAGGGSFQKNKPIGNGHVAG